MVDGKPIIRAFFVPRQRGGVPRRLGRDGSDRHRLLRLRDLRAGRARPGSRSRSPIPEAARRPALRARRARHDLDRSRRFRPRSEPPRHRREWSPSPVASSGMGHATTVAGNRTFPVRAGPGDTAMLKAARALLFQTFAAAQAQLAAGGALSMRTCGSALRQATTHVCHVSSAVVDFAYHWSGADGIRPGRDPAAVARHSREHPAHLRRRQHVHRLRASPADDGGLPGGMIARLDERLRRLSWHRSTRSGCPRCRSRTRS